jgi:hypothetical protein
MKLSDVFPQGKKSMSLTWTLLHNLLLLVRSGLALSGQVQHVAHIGGGHDDIGEPCSVNDAANKFIEQDFHVEHTREVRQPE